MTPAECSTARTWLSASIDGEVLPDPELRAHVDTCSQCRAWEARVHAVARQVSLRAAGSPDVVAPAIAAFARHQQQAGRTQFGIARGILVAAGLLGLVLAAATALGAFGHMAGHPVRDLVALESALAVGFLVGAWRPDRYTRGLLPVAIAAGLFTLTSTASGITGTSADLVREASHIPVLLGGLGLFVLFDAMNASTSVRR